MFSSKGMNYNSWVSTKGRNYNSVWLSRGEWNVIINLLPTQKYTLASKFMAGYELYLYKTW